MKTKTQLLALLLGYFAFALSLSAHPSIVPPATNATVALQDTTEAYLQEQIGILLKEVAEAGAAGDSTQSVALEAELGALLKEWRTLREGEAGLLDTAEDSASTGWVEDTTDYDWFNIGSLEQPVTKFDFFEWSLGSNFFMSNADLFGSAQPAELTSELQPWSSVQFRATFGFKQKLGGERSPLLLVSGWSIVSNTFRFKGDGMITKALDANGTYTTTFAANENFSEVRNNSWTLAYFEVPLLLQLDGSKKGQVDKNLSLSAGLYGGIRLSSVAQVRGSDIEGDRLILRQNGNYNSALFRYGMQAQLGYKAFKLTGRVDLAPIFQPNTFVETVHNSALSVGTVLVF